MSNVEQTMIPALAYELESSALQCRCDYLNDRRRIGVR